MTSGSADIYPANIAVSLDALSANANRLRQLADGAEVLAVVKANGYGFGRTEAALRLWNDGIRWFGVSKFPEAAALRDTFTAAGISHEDSHILTWLNVPGQDWRSALAAHLDVSVSNLDQLEQVTSAMEVLRSEGAGPEPARIHLKMDVGMGRGGATLLDLQDLAAAVAQAEHRGDVELVGFWSHLSSADDPFGPGDEITRTQIAAFAEGESLIHAAGLAPQFRHLAATSGTVWYPEARLDMVRPGIGLYGHSPAPAVADSAALGLSPVGVFRAPITQVKRVEQGQTVSYGATWTAPRVTWIGLLPIGYADGVPRALSNGAEFLVEAADGPVKSAVLGRVCMDQTMIDLGSGPEPLGRVGDTVVLFGDPARGEPSIEQWAELGGTVNYEVIARLPEHITRSYQSGADK